MITLKIIFYYWTFTNKKWQILEYTIHYNIMARYCKKHKKNLKVVELLI